MVNEQPRASKCLLQEELTRYLSILSNELDTQRVILFGSLASDQVRDESDIDLVVVKETSLPFIDRLHEVRRLLRPRVDTDILVYTPAEYEALCRTRAFVRDEISGKGVVLYERRR